EVFAELVEGNPDGVALDAEGALWVAGGPSGSLVRVLAAGAGGAVVGVPARFVSSLCFAGPALDEVFITTADNLATPDTGGTLFRARAEVPGVPLPQGAQPLPARPPRAPARGPN